MDRNGNSKQRLIRVLDGDKEEMNEASRLAALRDLERVAGEYFETEGRAELTVERDKNGIAVCFRFRACRVKNFTSLK